MSAEIELQILLRGCLKFIFIRFGASPYGPGSREPSPLCGLGLAAFIPDAPRYRGSISGVRLKDIAIALDGEVRVSEEWSYNRSLKDRAVRARDRGRAFVEGGYCDLLRRASF